MSVFKLSQWLDRVDNAGASWVHADERVLLNEYLWTFDVDYLKVRYFTLLSWDKIRGVMGKNKFTLGTLLYCTLLYARCFT